MWFFKTPLQKERARVYAYLDVAFEQIDYAASTLRGVEFTRVIDQRRYNDEFLARMNTIRSTINKLKELVIEIK